MREAVSMGRGPAKCSSTLASIDSGVSPASTRNPSFHFDQWSLTRIGKRFLSFSTLRYALLPAILDDLLMFSSITSYPASFSLSTIDSTVSNVLAVGFVTTSDKRSASFTMFLLRRVSPLPGKSTVRLFSVVESILPEPNLSCVTVSPTPSFLTVLSIQPTLPGRAVMPNAAPVIRVLARASE